MFVRPQPRPKQLKDKLLDGTTSIVECSLPSERIKYAQAELEKISSMSKPVVTNEKKMDEEDEIYDVNEIKKLEDETEFLREETFSGGLMAALKAAREKGHLGDHDIEISGTI